MLSALPRAAQGDRAFGPDSWAGLPTDKKALHVPRGRHRARRGASLSNGGVRRRVVGARHHPTDPRPPPRRLVVKPVLPRHEPEHLVPRRQLVPEQPPVRGGRGPQFLTRSRRPVLGPPGPCFRRRPLAPLHRLEHVGVGLATDRVEPLNLRLRTEGQPMPQEEERGLPRASSPSPSTRPLIQSSTRRLASSSNGPLDYFCY